MFINEEQSSHPIDEHEQQLSRLATIGQISAGIAHEIRNPLTVVKGFLQLLQKEYQHHYLDIACTELDRAILTLHDLLQISKPDQCDATYLSVCLCTELEAVLSLFQDKMYHVHLNKHFSDKGTMISGQQNQLKKAFFNLLKNAFEAIPGEGTITIGHYRKEDAVCVSISDTGIGIPKEKIRLLGTPFLTTNTKSEGTGRGLTQVYAVLCQHKARIEVDSREGEGTMFTIHFPLDRQT